MGIRITPSILNANLAALNEEIARIPSADAVHLDVMDNRFVPNLTFGLPMVQSVRAGTDKMLDVHLMIAEVDRWAPGYAEAGAESVTFHIEASDAPVKLARELRALGARASMALRPATPIEPYADLLDELDMVLLMTVEPGFGGQSFLDVVLPKLRRTRALLDARGGDIWLQVDGGISAETIERCVGGRCGHLRRRVRRSTAPTTRTRWCGPSRRRPRAPRPAIDQTLNWYTAPDPRGLDPVLAAARIGNVKHLLFAAAFVVELVAWIASAGSLLIRIDGWPGWVVTLAVFAVIVALWQAAMCRRAPWPLPLWLYYVCKAMLYTFAALVLWFYADWAGMAFAASVVVTEPAAGPLPAAPGTAGGGACAQPRRRSRRLR